jgi:transposase
VDHLAIINPLAGGIDIGATEVWAGVPDEVAEPSYRCFETFTDSFEACGDWLVSLGITTVAMEATGVYWIALYDILTRRGIDVVLVDAHKTKNVSGRKSDILDCQWIQTLHSYGLLPRAHCPDEETAALRTYERTLQTLTQEQQRFVQRMQKAMLQMNLHLHHAISDITGVSGMAILRAIVRGNHDPASLADLCNKRIKASRDTIIRALTGHYRADLLFALASALRQYDAIQVEIDLCNRMIRDQVIRMHGGDPDQEPPPPTSKRKAESSLKKEIVTLCGGRDPTAIDGIGTQTALSVLAETGPDLSAWKTCKHFTSWMGLSPNRRITGGKVISSRTTRTKRNRAGQAFRQAAESLLRSKTYLGAFARRMRARHGAAHALTATARKLATLFYQVVQEGLELKDLSADHYEMRYKERRIKGLEKAALSMGYQLVPNLAE